MELHYDIDAGREHVRIAGTGRLTMPAMVAVVDRVAEDPRFSSRFSVLFDLSDAEYTAELGDGEAFVAALRRRLEDFQGRFALMVPTSLHFLAQMYCLLAQMGGFDRMQCFTDRDEALKWCGLSE